MTERTHLEGLKAVSKGVRITAFPGPDGGVVAARQQAGDTGHAVARDLVPGGLLGRLRIFGNLLQELLPSFGGQ